MFWIKVRYKLKLWRDRLLFALGFEQTLLKNRYGERILVFHGVDQKGSTAYNSRFISKTYFESLIRHFKQEYHLISVEDFYQKKFKPNVMNLALTFDDGYWNNFEYVLPILEKYEVPASFYITPIHDQASKLWPDFLDLITFYTSKKSIHFDGKTFYKNSKKAFVFKNTNLKDYCKGLEFSKIKGLYALLEEDWKAIERKDLADYWQLMNKAQLKKIAHHPLFTIGAHGWTHANLEGIDIEAAKAEILNSKKKLETMAGKTIDEFAFPFGFYTNELVAYAENIGFSKVLLVDYKTEEAACEEATRERFVMNPYISQRQQLLCLLRGAYY